MKTRDLLVEIGTEELPPKALLKLSNAFKEQFVTGLKSAELSFDEVIPYATPRRLALLVKQLQEQQQDKSVERRGPALQAAYDADGAPTKAALGFARSCGVDIKELDTLETDKGSWLSYQSHQPGKPASDLIVTIVNKALDALPIPKRMRWGDLQEQFVRPVHWAVLLFGNDVIDTSILSVNTGRVTYGHRFHHPAAMTVSEPADYARLLQRDGYVIADFSARRDLIREQIQAITQQVNGQAIIDENLLDEVTGMVEWPMAILGNFDERFLQVPAEALISAMKGHQKYFHVVDDQQRLMPHFITISNIDSKQPDQVRAGNERVIRPRLTDAEFFWNQDKKRPLKIHAEGLSTVVFESRLGTLADKQERIAELASFIANALQWKENASRRTGQLCKADLMTDMVAEFPELQGIMGKYYAQHDGEPDEVAQAIQEHYMPRFSGDDLPATEAGLCVALADKIDTLVGIFSIGQIPTGDKDPYALRRAALGVLRMIIEKGLALDIDSIVKSAIKNYTYQSIPIKVEHTTRSVYDFIQGRLQVYFQQQGYSADEIDAVLCLRPTRFQDAHARLQALAAFRQLPQADSLAAANKRISNILKKNTEELPAGWNAASLQTAEEKTLASAIETLSTELQPLLEQQDYTAVMNRLANLGEAIDAFFDTVMVMSDDATERLNRLSLLAALRGLFLRVADLSRLQ
jgi:glycyl-tRNA synthetase beta chain